MTRRAGVAAAALALLAAALGWLATPAAEAGAALAAAGPELARLLRLMALVKLGLAAGALVLVVWRLRFPAGRARAAGYALACALMAAAPGPIWGLAHVAAGAALFHAGLVLLLVLGWGDGGARRVIAPRASPALPRLVGDPAAADGEPDAQVLDRVGRRRLDVAA